MSFNHKEFFIYTKDQRKSLLLLATIIIILQFFCYFSNFNISPNDDPKEKQMWLSIQHQIDSLKIVQNNNSHKIYPFNPNFISDYKGYKLGMTVKEIDRLFAFRETGQYVNTAKEFQQVTKIPDSLLKKIAPFFKFPDWVNKKNKTIKIENNQNTQNNYTKYNKPKEIIVQDINQATKEDLMKIFGIGDAISERIIKQRTILGGYVNMDQMNEIWGLSPEVMYDLNKNFKIGSTSSIIKININNASLKELMKLTYFKYSLAREIITYRSMHNGIHNIDDLTKIKGFPIDKLKNIALYLEF